VHDFVRSPPSVVSTATTSKLSEQHRHCQLDLKQREIAPGQMRGPEPNGIAMRFAAAASPSQRVGSNAAAFWKVAVVDAVAAHDAPDERARRHEYVGHRSCHAAPRCKERRHWLQAHRLARAGVEVVQRLDSLESQRA
jgi:hypothetical protein